MILPDDVRHTIEAHARASLPHEACGLLATDGTGAITKAYPTANSDASAHRFTIDPDGHWAALQDAESNGWTLCGSFHSHPTSPPVPSRADVSGALDPAWITVIAGPVESGPIDIRAYLIRDGVASRIEVGSA